jgi:hypothetical protein
MGAFVDHLKIQALACATLVMALTNGSAAAQAATDVVCTQCIGSSDIANDAVGSAKIKEGSIASNDIAANAVKSVNIGNGAITYGKLSPVLRDQLDGTLNHIWFLVIADIAESTAGVACPSESYPVSASCKCDDEDGFRNFGLLYNCEIVGLGVTSGCFVDSATFDPQRSPPAAHVNAYCMAATRTDGSRWSPFPETRAPVDSATVEAASPGERESEWHRSQQAAFEAALLENRAKASARHRLLMQQRPRDTE